MERNAFTSSKRILIEERLPVSKLETTNVSKFSHFSNVDAIFVTCFVLKFKISNSVNE